MGALSEQAQKFGGAFTLVLGAASSGAEALAHQWLYLDDPACDLPCCDPETQGIMRQHEETHAINWAMHGSDAVAVRNQLMVDRGADRCLAFLLEGSYRAVDCMTRARIAGSPVTEYAVTHSRT